MMAFVLHYCILFCNDWLLSLWCLFFTLEDRKGVEGGQEGLRGMEGGEATIRMHFVRKDSIFNKRKKKQRKLLI